MHRADILRSGPPEQYFLPITLMDLKELWRTHFRVELLAEDLRRQLEVNPLFSLNDAFAICDSNHTGEFTIHELRRLIESRGFFVSDKEAISIMEKFDKDKRGAVTKQEFMQELIPKSPFKNGARK